MKRKIGVVVILLAALILVVIGVGGYLMFTGPVISAEGFSSIKVMPDEVSVNINIETRNKSAVDAQEKNKEIGEKLLSELVKLGFDRKDLRFVNQYVYPEYDYNYREPKIKGYVVSQQLVVKTKEVDKVASIVDIAINSGAMISYINFEVSEEKKSEYKNQVLRKASEDAKIKAESIAAGQGKKLGRLVSITNQNYNYPEPIPYYTRAEDLSVSESNLKAKAAVTNLSPDEQEITASISAQYKLSWF